jgi:VanZ family protein
MQQHTKNTQVKKPSFINAYGAALIWAAFILLLMSLPGKDLPDFDFWAIDIEDKIGHVAVFGLLSFLMVWGLIRRDEKWETKSLGIIAFLGVVYGGATELLQGYAFPSRYASLLDFLADTVGAVLGTVFAVFIFTKLRRQKS